MGMGMGATLSLCRSIGRQLVGCNAEERRDRERKFEMEGVRVTVALSISEDTRDELYTAGSDGRLYPY